MPSTINSGHGPSKASASRPTARSCAVSVSYTHLSTHPNQLAALISFFLPLLVSLAVGPRPGPSRRLWRVALALVTLLVVAILILTQSRGGWIATAAGLFALAALWAAVLPPSRARRGLRLVVGLAVLAALAVTVWICLLYTSRCV